MTSFNDVYYSYRLIQTVISAGLSFTRNVLNLFGFIPNEISHQPLLLFVA